MLVCFSWTTFASIYYTIAFFHGDLSPEFHYLNRTQCVVNLDSIYSSFLFAVETHHTIGYGHRWKNNHKIGFLHLLVALFYRHICKLLIAHGWWWVCGRCHTVGNWNLSTSQFQMNGGQFLKINQQLHAFVGKSSLWLLTSICELLIIFWRQRCNK